MPCQHVHSGCAHLRGDVFSVKMRLGNWSELGKAEMEPRLFYHQKQMAATMSPALSL